eukprot:scaffold154_cov69-Skeletonema_menzelii.AAC.1
MDCSPACIQGCIHIKAPGIPMPMPMPLLSSRDSERGPAGQLHTKTYKTKSILAGRTETLEDETKDARRATRRAGGDGRRTTKNIFFDSRV